MHNITIDTNKSIRIEKCGNYEPDSSPEAWAFYKKVYASAFEESTLNSAYDSSEKKRICIKDPLGVEFAGDVVFNFKYGFYEWQLKGNTDSLNRLALFNQNDYHYAYCNLSLMPRTGKLQGVKGIIYKDRVDKFLHELKLYYLESNEEHPFITLYRGKGRGKVSHRYKELLKVFLDSMGEGKEGFVNYCEKIYNIGEILANKLAESGTGELDTADKVIYYMDLAEEFWNERKEYLKTFCNKANELV